MTTPIDPIEALFGPQVHEDEGSEYTWNHRVLLHKGTDAGEDYYGIHEVHYEDGVPRAYTTNPVEVGGESVKSLKITLERMLRCLELPVLTPEDFKHDTLPDAAKPPTSQGA